MPRSRCPLLPNLWSVAFLHHVQRPQERRGRGLPDRETRCGQRSKTNGAQHARPAHLGANWPIASCPAATARVVNATSVAGRVSGRLELFHQGTWKPACAAGFSNFAATVVCKQVGGWWANGDLGSEVKCWGMHVPSSAAQAACWWAAPHRWCSCSPLLQLKLGTAGAALPNNAFGRGASGARLASIQCKGNEANWEACRAAVWATAPCGAQGDVAVLCTSPAGRLPAAHGQAWVGLGVCALPGQPAWMWCFSSLPSAAAVASKAGRRLPVDPPLPLLPCCSHCAAGQRRRRQQPARDAGPPGSAAANWSLVYCVR